MKHVLFAFLSIAMLEPRPAGAVDVEALEGSSWYLHIDFDMMKKTEAGKGIYAWMEKEVLSDIKDETELDLRGKLERLTAFGESEDDAVFELEGRFDAANRKQMLAMASKRAKKKTHGGKAYYQVEKDTFRSDDGEVKIDIDSDWYLTFALEDRIVIAQSEKRMRRVLDSNGALPTRGGATGSIFVLSSEKRLMQAGADAQRIREIDPDEKWDSNILKNTKKVGLLVADQDGKLAIDLRLEASEPTMARSLRNIVLGLIGLSAFNDDMDPKLAEILRSTNVTLEENVLRLRIAAAPQTFIELVED